MRKLSEAHREYSAKINTYAKCTKCNEVFIDDFGMYGSVLCPNGCKGVLYRGYKPQENEIEYVVCDGCKGDLTSKYLCETCYGKGVVPNI
jgi:hypothetical protein